jgi:hypothetical protein
MSRHRNQPEMRRGISRFACSLLSGLLLASQLVLPPVTFALSASRASSADPPPSPSLAQSEVSVVRLVFDYTAKPASAGNPVLCTSLGVLVKSFPASTASPFNSWVLTDGSLLNTSPSPCAPTGSGSTGTSYTLATINVYANTVYTGNTSANALLGTYSAVPSNGFVCVATPCPNGAFLFAIHTDQLQPTLDIATANTTQQFGVALTNGTSPTARPPVPLSSIAVAVTFLNPASVSLAATNSQSEVGMPIINNAGQLVAMRLQGNIEFTATDYQAFVTQRSLFTSAPANPLQAAWERGITAYYRQHYQDAIKAFQRVETLNPRFKAAHTFELEAAALSHSQGNPSGGSSVTPSGNTTFFGLPRSTFLIVAIAASFLLLIVLLIIVSVWARRRHDLASFEEEPDFQRQQQPKNEVVNEESNTSSDSASIIHRLSTFPLFTAIHVQSERAFKFLSNYKQSIPIQQTASVAENVSTNNPQSPPDTLCPNCAHTVRVGATYCPNCRYQLSPLVRGALPTLNISPVPVLPNTDKDFAPSAATDQPPVKESVLDDLAIQATLKRLWDKAS